MPFNKPVAAATRKTGKAAGVFVVVAALLGLPAISANAYVPEGGVAYELGADPCLKGRGNCVVYPKSTELPSGRLVMAFEKSTVVPSTGTADRQTMPILKSDDDGTTWQPLAQVQAPAYASSDPSVAQYVSNWTNPNFYVLPEAIGDLAAGTLLLATVVSGDDEYFKERKAADPDFVPTNDGDRSNMAIALYSSTDDGATWSFENIVATGGWQGGSAGAIGINVAAANTNRQIDPIWEPKMLAYGGELIVYYSDENDYLSFDPATGIPVEDPDNDTAPDSRGQVLVHKTWDGSAAGWSEPVIDVPGRTENRGDGKTQIGGGRPGMTTVAPTTDGKWIMTFEYFGGGDNVRYKIADDPTKFFAASDFDGEEISRLPVQSGSRPLTRGGSPVIVGLPDGRIIYNAAGSGSIWVNESGRSDGTWVEYQAPLGSGYSRTLQYVSGTGRVVILQSNWGGPTAGAVIRHADVDLGDSAGEYYRLVNRKTGQVMGTGGRSNDANLGNANQPDIRLEDAGVTADPDTQYWHVVTKADGNVVLLNKSGGREASVWTGNATPGQRLGQWVDNNAAGRYRIVDAADGYVQLQVVRNTAVYVTGSTAGAPITVQNAVNDGSQDWKLELLQPDVAVTATVESDEPGEDGWQRGRSTVTLEVTEGTADLQYRVNGGQWTAYAAPIQLDTDGEYIVGYRGVVSGSPVAASEGTTEVRIDATAPRTSVQTTPSSGSATVGETVTARFTADDATSGVARTEYSVNGSDWQTVDPDGVSATEAGEYVISYRSVDVAGNVEEERTVTLNVVEVQSSAEVRIVSADDPSADGWYRQPVLVSLTAPAAGQRVQYAIDGGTWRNYSRPITVSANGITELRHRVLENSVVVPGSDVTTEIKIDRQLPTVAATRDPGGRGTPRNPVTVSLTGADALSGLARVEYRVNRGEWTTATDDDLVLDAVGVYIVSYRAVDNAGNTSATRALTAIITADPATVVRTAASVRAGGVLTVSIAGYTRFDDVSIRLGERELGTVLTDQNGSARVSLRVPAGTPFGATTLTAGTADDALMASTTVRILR